MERALVLVGAGPIGVASARAALDDGVVATVAAVVDPDDGARRRAGETLGAAGVPHLEELKLVGDQAVAIVAFSSRAGVTALAVCHLLRSGFHVVTTCEELADPPENVREDLIATARRAGKVAIATGANPGFVMDRLPLLLAGGSRNVRRVAVVRRVDTSTRREPLVRKTGYGLSPEAFAAGVEAGGLGHVGLDVSAHLVADGMGWKLVDEREVVEPVLGEGGKVAGLHQTFDGATDDGRSLHYDLTMAWGLERPEDRVIIDGSPHLAVAVEDGYPGDEGTVARVVRGLAIAPKLAPGFYRPSDLPVWG